MIRFSAALVVAAIGVLIGGVVTSSLLLVYVAIGVSALALVALAVGVALKREELFGEAKSATSGTPERAGQSAGLQGTQQELPSRSQVPLASGVSGYGSAFSRADVPAPHPGGTFEPGGSEPRPAQDSIDRPADASRFPGRPGAWPPPESRFPSAPADASAPLSGKPSRFRHPAAPPTRADPVLPWAGTLPTRVDVAKGKSQDPVPSWLDDVDDQPVASSSGLSARKSAGLDVPAETDLLIAGGTSTADASAGPLADTVALLADTVALQAMPSTDALSDDVTGIAVAEPDPSGVAVDAEAGSIADAGAEDTGAEDAGGDGTTAVGDAASGEDSLDAGSSGRNWIDASWDTDDASVTDTTSTLDKETDDAGADSVAPSLVDAGPDDASGPDDANKPGEGDAPGEGRRLSGTDQVAVVPGVPRFHDFDCILIRFMDDGDVQRMTATQAEQAGCTPCSACQPED